MLKIIRNDKGSEFIGVELKSYLEQLEVKQQFTTNYTPKKMMFLRETNGQ
jgi:hypothetical protein